MVTEATAPPSHQPPAAEARDVMKAFTLHGYGTPDQLRPAELDKPVPGDDEVLVRVRATSINPYDWHHLRGEPYVARLMGGTLGPRRPKIGILGTDMSGQVEAVGKAVTDFRRGDEVYAMLVQGGFAEYVCVPERELARKPANLSFEQAAAVPMAANTALLAVRDQARVQPGQKVLVNGASGGVGTFAVQLARAFGAEVTGVCSTRNLELVRSLGAHKVIDYTAADFTGGGERYDVVLDIAGSRSVLACRRVLARSGRHVLVGGPAGRWLQPAGHMFASFAMAPLLPQQVVLADVVGCTENRQNLQTLAGLIEEGSVTPVIDRRYRFEEIPEALRYQEEGHAPGKVVVTV